MALKTFMFQPGDIIINHSQRADSMEAHRSSVSCSIQCYSATVLVFLSVCWFLINLSIVRLALFGISTISIPESGGIVSNNTVWRANVSLCVRIKLYTVCNEVNQSTIANQTDSGK